MKLKDDSMKTLIKLTHCRKTDKGKKRENNLPLLGMKWGIPPQTSQK